MRTNKKRSTTKWFHTGLLILMTSASACESYDDLSEESPTGVTPVTQAFTASDPLGAVVLGGLTKFNITGNPSHTVKSDTWSTAWKSDGTLYALMNDHQGGFGPVSTVTGNLGMGRIVGTPVAGNQGSLTGYNTNTSSINTNNVLNIFGDNAEQRWEHNQVGWEQQVNDPAADGPAAIAGQGLWMWKGNGLISVDGVLYMSVSRHAYGQHYSDGFQRARDATIIKSTDNGASWDPVPYTQAGTYPLSDGLGPMFPGNKFATPIFVDHGKDTFEQGPHRGYVYAISTDGFWDNGDNLYLGRVSRANLPNLNPADWTFYTGRNASGVAQWGTLAAATPILSKTNQLGQTSATYIPGLHKYVMLTWHYPNLTNNQFLWGNPVGTQIKTTKWDFYESPNPWGPWTWFGSSTDSVNGAYNPSIPGKFVTWDGVKATAWILSTGNFATWADCPTQLLYDGCNSNNYITTKYTLHWQKVDITPGTNLLTNGSFDSGCAGGTCQTITGWSESSTVAASYVQEGSRSWYHAADGTHRLTHWKNGAAYRVYTYQDVNIPSTGTYRLSGQGMTGGRAYTNLEIKNCIAQKFVVVPASSGYTPLALTASLKQGMTCRVGVWTNSPANGFVLIDKIQLVKM